MADTPNRIARRSAGSSWWNLLLLIPFVALLWVPIYNRVDPKLFGIPFFYWYQFLWVILASVVTWIVHACTRADVPPDRSDAP
jgi:hypothetical protein